MTPYPRRVRAGDVLRAIESRGPASLVQMSVHFRGQGGRLWTAVWSLIHRGLIAGIGVHQSRALDLYNLTLKGCALLADRRAKGRA